MMEVSTKVASNLRLLGVAKDMAVLIGQWRAEISESKDFRVTIDVQRLGEFLVRMEAGGRPATLVAYTVLYCEWSFRVRRATETDIERALSDIEQRLGRPPHGPLTASQAHMLVKAVEPGLRKQMQGVRVPIVYGFSPEPLVMWSESTPTRRADTPLIPTRRGSLPVVGPILAGLVTEALFAQQDGVPASGVGADLCAILLTRRILAVEYAKWKQNAGAFKVWRHRKPGLAEWLARVLQRSCRQRVEQEGLSAERLLQQCRTAPHECLGRSLAPELIQRISAVPWNAAKTGQDGRKEPR